MDQLGLPLRDPVARHDPVTSRAAVDQMKALGTLHAGLCRTLLALARWTGDGSPTSHELAGEDLKARHEIARRLPELREKRLVVNGSERVCHVTGHRALTWRLTAEGCVALHQIPARGPVDDPVEDESTGTEG